MNIVSNEPVTETSPAQVRQAEQQRSESEEIVNAPVIVKAFGREYEIKRFTLGPAFRALEYVGPFGYLLRTVMALPRDAEGKIAVGQNEMIDLAVTAISISGPSALGLISVATNEPPEWLEDKDVFEGVDVLAAVLEKNLDFFSPENIEKVTKVLGGLQRSILAYGGNTSTTS